MSLTELLPAVGALPHSEKLCLLQYLANSLARDEGLPEIRASEEFAIWSPYDAFGAATILQSALDADRGA
jgi:hypothetical protein